MIKYQQKYPDCWKINLLKNKQYKHKKYPYYIAMDPASGKDYSVKILCRKVGNKIEIVKMECRKNDKMPKM